MYKRIASVSDSEELQELQEEMIDRFGLIPEPLKNLFKIGRLKLKAGPLGIRKIDANESGGRIHFQSNSDIDAGRLIQLIQSQPNRYKLDGQDKLRIIEDMPEIDSRISMISELLDSISMRNAA